jgi:DNA topoisomerase VI subunit B
MAEDHEQIYADFKEAVNMAPAELEKFLDTDESKEVGQKKRGSDESVGHESGRKIIAIKHKKKADLTDDDYAHMKKVVGYVHRHLKQGGPDKDAEHSPWRYSLMNWGHDPLKD